MSKNKIPRTSEEFEAEYQRLKKPSNPKSEPEPKLNIYCFTAIVWALLIGATALYEVLRG